MRRAAIAAAVSTVCMLAGAHVTATRPAAQSPAPPSPERELVSQYCVRCHNQRMKSGGVSLDAADPINAAIDTRLWEHVVRKLRARAMPPAGAPRPDDASFDRLIASLESSLDRAAALNPTPGRVDPIRRLNRTEYRNAIRDILALDVDVTELLPVDEASHGFDNVSVSGLSPTLMERYLAAAQKIARVAVGSTLRDARQPRRRPSARSHAGGARRRSAARHARRDVSSRIRSRSTASIRFR